MAILDRSKKPLIADRDTNVFIGIDLPFRKSDGPEGWFASNSTTINAVKQNIRNLLNTKKGERIMQPNLGLDLHRFLFEPITEETKITIQSEIVDTFNFWLPFITLKNIVVSENIDRNEIKVVVDFFLNQDPNTLESVSTTIGE